MKLISKLTLIVFLISLISITSCDNRPDIKTTEQLFRAMKSKNDSSWFQNFTFKQNTIFFDTLERKKDSALWCEAVSYPNYFRIDRDTVVGNYTIYRNDSTYHILADTLYSATASPAVHLLFKGGLYFISLDETMERLSKYGFNLNTFRKDVFHDEPVYVIGEDDKQFWLHAEDYYCVRRISTNSQNKKTDVIYENFKQLGQGWVEQKVTFYFDGKKRMEEFYLDIKLRDALNSKIFEIKNSSDWYLNY